MIQNEDIDPRPTFCPYTGQDCPSVGEDCTTSYCFKIQKILDQEPNADERKMCHYWQTCLLSIIDDCCGSYDESRERNCRAMPVFVKIERFNQKGLMEYACNNKDESKNRIRTT